MRLDCPHTSPATASGSSSRPAPPPRRPQPRPARPLTVAATSSADAADSDRGRCGLRPPPSWRTKNDATGLRAPVVPRSPPQSTRGDGSHGACRVSLRNLRLPRRRPPSGTSHVAAVARPVAGILPPWRRRRCAGDRCRVPRRLGLGTRPTRHAAALPPSGNAAGPPTCATQGRTGAAPTTPQHWGRRSK